MKEYKRLTKKDWHEAKFSRVSEYEPSDRVVLKQLWELENKIDNGTLIELPCKVGTTLYFIYNRPYADKPNLEPKIHETNNWYFDVCQKGIAISTRNPYGYNGEYFYYLGDMVFLSSAEAEKKLKELFMDLNNIREIIKNDLKDNLADICDLADKVQALGFRVCPRNIYQNKKAEKICVNPCRKRFATCFKKYFKEQQNER